MRYLPIAQRHDRSIAWRPRRPHSASEAQAGASRQPWQAQPWWVGSPKLTACIGLPPVGLPRGEWRARARRRHNLQVPGWGRINITPNETQAARYERAKTSDASTHGNSTTRNRHNEKAGGSWLGASRPRSLPRATRFLPRFPGFRKYQMGHEGVNTNQRIGHQGHAAMCNGFSTICLAGRRRVRHPTEAEGHLQFRCGFRTRRRLAS